MISYLGNFFIILSLIVSIISIIFFIINKKNEKIYFEVIYYINVRLVFLFITLAFCCLLLAYLLSDFTNLNVFFNSHTNKPLIYKFAGVWSNHEGSLLLWILIMSTYTFIFSFEKKINKKIINWTIFFQIIMIVGFLLFMILTSNPFTINPGNPNQGMGLNPILQDPALAIHPPLLYSGYVGYSLVLSMALSGLITDGIEKNWIQVIKKYSLFCWLMLTLGIGVGSFWAYYELGWGGWWFWDPVENASLMPWLAGIALIHSLQILNQNLLLKRWIIFLSILCFSLSLLGTFLVRSGILMSVHAFANDSSRGIFILLIFLVITGFSFLLFIIKTPTQNKATSLLEINKTSFLIINNIIMTIACFTVLLGTIYPLIIESITNERISVGAPYFNSTVLPILFPGLLLMAIAPALSWGKNELKNFILQIRILLIITLILMIIYILSNINLWGLIGLGLSFWIMISSIYQIYIKFLKNFNHRKFRTIISNNGSIIAHLGIGILILGITVSSVWKKEYIYNMKVGEIKTIQGYEIKLEEVKQFKVDNYETLKGKFILQQNNKKIATIVPEKRYYAVSKIVTTEAGILHQLKQDIYLIIGENNTDYWSVKIYQNPLVSFIWIGIFISFIGGLISLKR
tara:strand:+ start:11072 stop:12961 length:1890 start_codon:yes stop_codon:yes gene_type:complete